MTGSEKGLQLLHVPAYVHPCVSLKSPHYIHMVRKQLPSRTSRCLLCPTSRTTAHFQQFNRSTAGCEDGSRIRWRARERRTVHARAVFLWTRTCSDGLGFLTVMRCYPFMAADVPRVNGLVPVARRDIQQQLSSALAAKLPPARPKPVASYILLHPMVDCPPAR